jgi:hypothetical protein
MPLTDGGTTPPCDRTPFGKLVGQPAPGQARLLIDFEGPPPANGTSAGIIVVRSPQTTAYTGAALQIGFPGDLSNMPAILNGMEIWCPSYVALLLYLPQPNAAFRDVIPSLPVHGQFTVQVSFLLSAPVTAGNPAAGFPCGGTEVFSASPGLFLDY